jgi:hypothetical protein
MCVLFKTPGPETGKRLGAAMEAMMDNGGNTMRTLGLLVAVTMNFGPAVLMNSGPPPAV